MGFEGWLAVVVSAILALLGFGAWQRRKGRTEKEHEIATEAQGKLRERESTRSERARETAKEADAIDAEAKAKVERIQEETRTTLEALGPDDAEAFLERARKRGSES